MAAATLSPDCSLSLLLDEACFNHARLEANPLTLPYAADYDAFFVEWQKCNEQEIKLRTAIVRRNAHIISRDDTLNELVDAVQQAVLLSVKNDRKASLYLLYFGSQSASEQKKPILAAQLEKMRGWIPSLTASPIMVLSALGERLVQAVAAADEAIAARLLAEQQNRDFRTIGQRKTLVDSLNGLRKATYGKLSELPHARPELHLPASFAEPFFRHESGKKNGGDLALTPEDLTAQLAESRAQTAKLEAQLAQALATAEADAKEKTEADAAEAELLQAQKSVVAAAAKVAAFKGKKKS